MSKLMCFVLESDKKAPSPLLYHLSFIVLLAEGNLPTWYPSQEVSSSSFGNAYSAARNYFRL
jgi:hypothetical protein